MKIEINVKHRIGDTVYYYDDSFECVSYGKVTGYRITEKGSVEYEINYGLSNPKEAKELFTDKNLVKIPNGTEIY